MDVPDTGIVVDIVPAVDAGKRRVQEHRAPGHRGILAGEGMGDLAAEIVPDDIDVVEFLRLCELIHILGQGIGVIAAARNARLSYAAQVQGHHRESLGQSWHDGAIFGPILRKAMDKAGPTPPLTKCSRTPFTLAMFEVKPGGTPLALVAADTDAAARQPPAIAPARPRRRRDRRMLKSFRYEILNTSPKSLIRRKCRQYRHRTLVLAGSFRSWKLRGGQRRRRPLRW
jgi:hypothetical protein